MLSRSPELRPEMVFGQFAATTQFYLYGRKHFTRTGWEAASRLYPRPDPLEAFDLAGKTYVLEIGGRARVYGDFTDKQQRTVRAKLRAPPVRKDIRRLAIALARRATPGTWRSRSRCPGSRR